MKKAIEGVQEKMKALTVKGSAARKVFNDHAKAKLVVADKRKAKE